MLFSETAPPTAIPNVPATPPMLASVPLLEALMFMYPKPRSGLKNPPKCRRRVSNAGPPAAGLGACGCEEITGAGWNAAGAASADFDAAFCAGPTHGRWPPSRSRVRSVALGDPSPERVEKADIKVEPA